MAGLFALAVLACDSAPARAPDGSAAADAGRSNADAALVPSDSGSLVHDSGGQDAGPPESMDAHGGPADAPAGGMDAAPPASDTGSPNPMPDSGPGPVDSGVIMPPPPPAMVCTSTVHAADTSHPTTVVGTGAGTCTESALRAAVQSGGVITFNCGGMAQIPLTSELAVPGDRDTVIDGGGMITLDGQAMTRILHLNGMGMPGSQHTLTVQHLTFANGRSTGTAIPSAAAPCAQGFEGDGSGGAILVVNAVLHVVDAVFLGNQAPLLGPDVGGGAIYARGSDDTTVVQSRFAQNAGSNGGAIGSLFTRLTVVNSTFDHNMAAGMGENMIDPNCPPQPGTNLRESGSGGNGGAIVIDGSETATDVFCGDTFTHNVAGALGGAIFRTPDNTRQSTQIDRSFFDSNGASGGGVLYFHHSDLALTDSTLSNNLAMMRGGAIQADDTTLTITNDTFFSNNSMSASGGAIALFNAPGAVILNATFAQNHASSGPGHFGAAIFSNSPFTISNSVFSDNTTQDAFNPMTCAIGGGTSGSGNVQWPQNHAVGTQPDTPCTSGTAIADPMLGPLSNNGGPTPTLEPGAGSPAIGAGMMCPMTDQRGVNRRTPCTSGACEGM